MIAFDTLSTALAANRRDDRHLVFIDGEDRQHELSFAALERRALALLGQLRTRGVAVGDALILFVNDNQRFIELFWACVLGGIVPVPLAVGAADEHRRKLFAVAAKFDRAWVCAETASIERLQAHAAAQERGAVWAALAPRLLPTEALDASGAPGRPEPRRPDDIAFVQFSSGSTGEPKGVVLSHRNLLANIASIAAAGDFSERDVALSWMPLSHDMGLIGFHLNMLACGVRHAIMRTDLFARRPLLWLQKASELRATVLCSPNFGYQHYLRQFETRRPQGLDLSAVPLVFNGAEPISAELCARFSAAMAPFGLAPQAMFPVYGLAEASLAVTFPEPGAPLALFHADRNAHVVGAPVRRLQADAPDAVDLVRLGRPVPGTELRIAGDDGAALGEGLLGHVWIRGANVTGGYYRNPEASAAALRPDGWLDTGDLGFCVDGELVIAGRAKDIIFVNGQNWYPHDIEDIATRVPGVEINKVVAVGVPDAREGGDRLVLFVLHRGAPEDLAPLARRLRMAVNQQTGLEVHQVLPAARIPKTTSGKLQRHALAEACLRGEFDAAAAALAPLLADHGETTGPDADINADSTVDRLLAICRTLVPDKAITPTTNLFEINLSSLTLARLHEAIDQAYPERLEVTDLFDYPTLVDLAGFLDRETA